MMTWNFTPRPERPDRERQLEAEVAWLRAALDAAREELRIAKEYLGAGARRC